MKYFRINIFLLLLLFNAKIIGQVNVEVPDTMEKEGKRISIPVIVSELSDYNVKSYKFKLLYDPEILKAKRIKDSGTISDQFGWDVHKDIDYGSIVVEAKGWLPLRGSGTLINIVFEVIGEEGFSPLIFDYFKFNRGSPEAMLNNGEFWVLNEKEIEFKKTGEGIGKISIDNIVYNLPLEIELIKGKTYTIEALPDDDSEFIKWSGSIESYSNPLIYKVKKDQKIECNFALRKVYVEVIVNPTEAGIIYGAGSYKKGENVTLQVIANYGWSFIGWFKNGVQLSNELFYSFIIESDNIIEVKFEKLVFNLNIVVNPSGGGIVTGGGYYFYQDFANLIAVPADGWEFINWTDNGLEFSTNPNIQFKVEDNSTVTANFERTLFSVTLSTAPQDAGVTSGGGYFYYGQAATVTALPNEGWVFDYWKEEDSIYSYDSTVTIEVYNERNLTANFSSLTSLNENIVDEITLFLSDPYPNPFNPVSKFKFSLPQPSKVTLIIVDLNGRIVGKILENKIFSSGVYEKSFNANGLSSGVYFYHYRINELTSNKIKTKNGKLVLLK